MLMVIFGAGASYDSIHPRHFEVGMPPPPSPPLAAELFEPRPEFLKALDANPHAAALVGRLRFQVEKGKDVEEAIEEEIALAEAGNPHRYPGLIALRFYLRRIISVTTKAWGDSGRWVTNYRLLLDDIEVWRKARDERVLLVTFNYDDLLEVALRFVPGFNLFSLDAYIERRDYQVFKLHGSVDWEHDTHLPNSVGGPKEIAARGEEIWAALQMVNTERRQLIAHSLGSSRGLATVPALAVPIKEKLSFECPVAHVDALQAAIPNVDRVLVIGWRAQERHFLNLCTELSPLALCGVVSGSADGADQVMRQLRSETPLTTFLPPATKGFSAAITSGKPLSDLLA